MDFEYAVKNIRGVWQLAFGGPDWRDDLDISVDGVFRSFWAVALAAPFSILVYLLTRRMAFETPEAELTFLVSVPLAVILTADLIGLFVDWLASLAALIFVARALHANNQTAQVIVGFNWAQVLAAAVIAVAVFLGSMTSNTDLFVLLYLPAVGFALALLWGLLRRSLPLDIGMTIALIAMLTLIGVIVNSSVTAGAVFLYHALS